MKTIDLEYYAVMSTDEKLILKGTTKSKQLCYLDDKKDGNKIMVYRNLQRAKNAMNSYITTWSIPNEELLPYQINGRLFDPNKFKVVKISFGYEDL